MNYPCKKCFFLILLGFSLIPFGHSALAQKDPDLTAPAKTVAPPKDRSDLRYAIANLTHENATQREIALDQLLASSYRDRSLVAILNPLVQDPSFKVQEKTILLLGEIGDPSATPGILEHTKSSIPEIRLAVAKSLGLLQSESSISALIYLSNDQVEDVAVEAINSIENFSDPQVVKSLTEISTNGPSYRQRSAAIRALGNIGSKWPTSKLIVLLQYERDIWLRLEIARTLSKIGDPQSKNPMMLALREIRQEANQQSDKRRKKVYDEIADEFEKAIADLQKNAGIQPSKKTKLPNAPAPQKDTPIALEPDQTETIPSPGVKVPEESEPQTAMEPTKPIVKKPSQEVVPPDPTKKPPKKVRPKPKKTFTIQIKSTPNSDLALALVEDLKSKGEEAFIVEFKKDNETWHRVRLGKFETLKAAEDYALNLQEKQVITEYYITH